MLLENFFKKNNDNKSIICIENTFIKINEEHSSNLDDTQKIRVFTKNDLSINL